MSAGTMVAAVARVAALILAHGGRAAAPNLFALARHRRLFRAWLRFGAALMPGGVLPRADSELLILRVAHNCGSEYEWAHHERIAQAVGLSAGQIAAVRRGIITDEESWTPRQELLLRAADELHKRRQISDELWSRLSDELTEVELIEVPMLVGHYEMFAMAIKSLRMQPDRPRRAPRRRRREHGELIGTRVLITGAARGIGAATAKRLYARGASVVLAGIEPGELARVAHECGDALAVLCDVRDRDQVDAAVEAAVEQLGGLDVVIANAGVATQLALVGGGPTIFERTLEVNLLGVYYTLRAAGPHIAHPRGYALAITSLAAAVHPPLLGAYSASKAGVEALADALRAELARSGARVGVAYFAELDTDMTRRGFATEAASRLRFARSVAPMDAGVDAIERAIERRSRRAVAPRWVAAVLPVRMLAQRLIDRAASRASDDAFEIARVENAPLTPELPDGSPLADGSRSGGR